MKFLKEHPTLTLNKTVLDVNNKQEVRNNDDEFQQVMAPWLLPVLVAVIMLIFLVTSFSLHHKRLVKHRRRTSQYYTLRYHRVAGPIFTCTAVDLDCGNNNKDNLMEPAGTPGSVTKNTSFSFRNKLGRYNTWSPRSFKHKIAAHIAHKKRLTSLKNYQNEILQIVDQLKNVSEGENQDCEVVSRLSSLLTGQPQLTSSELLSLADLTGLTRSYSCRARAVGVTTYTGTLAIAEHQEENRHADICDAVIAPACNSDLISTFRNTALTSPTAENDHQTASPFENVASPCFSNSLTQQISDDFVFNFDVNDDMFNAMSRKVSQATLPRYLEDDWTSPVAYVARPYIHLARSISSYDEGEEYTAESSSNLANLQHLFDSHDDAQPTTPDTSGLFSNLATNNRIGAEYDPQMDVEDQLESSRDGIITTLPGVGSAPCEPDLIPANSSSASANTFIANLSFSHLGRCAENMFTSSTHNQSTPHAKISETYRSEINVNTCTNEQLLNRGTTCASKTHGTEGWGDVILTSSGDDSEQLGSVSSLHTMHDQCYHSRHSTYRHLEELRQTHNLACLEELRQTHNLACLEEDNFENRQRISSAITPGDRKGEFSQCSVFVTGSDKVDCSGHWSEAGVDNNFNRMITSCVREGAFSSDVNSRHGSVGTIDHYETVPSWHTSMTRSSTDTVLTTGWSGQATLDRPVVLSVLKLGQTDLTCGQTLYLNRGSLSDSDIHSVMPAIDRQRGARKSLQRQADRQASLCCESWEEGVDRDYMDKSLVSLHQFVVS